LTLLGFSVERAYEGAVVCFERRSVRRDVVIALVNLISIAGAWNARIWQKKVFRALVIAQLLVVPIAAAIGFHYAIQAPA
jgi:hypothetical protein